MIAKLFWIVRLGSFYSMLFLMHHTLHAAGKPLSLQEVMEIALKNNLTIQAAESDCKKQLCTHKREASERWIPTAIFHLVEGEKWTQRKNDTKNWYFHGDLVITLRGRLQLIETMYQTRKIHQESLLARLRKTEKIRNELEEVVNCYHELAVAQKKLAMATVFVSMANAKVKLATTKLKVGQITKTEYLDIELTLEEAKLDFLEKQEMAKRACRQLNIRVGRAPNEALIVQSYISPKPIGNMAEIAKENITDLTTTIQEKEVLKAKTELARIKASFFSYVNLEGTFVSKKEEVFNTLKEAYDPPQPGSLAFKFGISLDLGELLFLPVKIREAKLAFNSCKLALTQKKLQAQEKWESIKSGYYHALAAYNIEIQKLKISKQKLQEAKEKYRLNRKTLIDLQEEEKKVYETEINVLNKGYTIKKEEFALYKLAGTLYN